jgi:DNA-binding NarL/FixJ family response regulator
MAQSSGTAGEADRENGVAVSVRIPVLVHADDPVSRSGVEAQLRGQPGIEVRLHDAGDPGDGTVAVVVVDEVDEAAAQSIRALGRSGVQRVLVVAGRLDDAAVLTVTEAGACGLLRRADAVPERLVPAVQAAAAGDGTVPPDLLGRLLQQIGRLQRQVLHPRGLTFGGLTDREVKVLKLVADGWDTSEIADNLSYSERTVKNIIHDVTSRLQLRNRSHAVAYALRQGLI